MYIRSNAITTLLLAFVVLKTAEGFSTVTPMAKRRSSLSSPQPAARIASLQSNAHFQVKESNRTKRLQLLMKNKNDANSNTNKRLQQRRRRRSFLQKSLLLLPYLSSATPPPPAANAFDGGVGGLGKTKPEMGILFVNPDDTSSPSSGNNEIVTNELIAPESGNIPVLVSFEAPWPTLKSSTNIESRDLANPEAAFVQVASKGGRSGDVLKKDFFEETIFGSQGKFGAYGSPTDIKIRRLPPPPPPPTSSASSSTTTTTHDIYTATFTTLTPAMRESERKAYISTYTIDNKDVFMLVVGTTANRFEKRDKLLKRVAESFVVVEAPKSSLSSLNRR